MASEPLTSKTLGRWSAQLPPSPCVSIAVVWFFLEVHPQEGLRARSTSFTTPLYRVRRLVRSWALGGAWPENIGLTLIGRIAPHPGLFAMEEIGQDRSIMDVDGSRHRPYGRHGHGMDGLGLAADPDMRLYLLQGVHAEVPLHPLRV